MIALSSQVFSLNGSSSLLNFSSWLMSRSFKSLHFWLCPSGLNKPQTGHWKTDVYDSRNALESASALRTLAQYARSYLRVSSLKSSSVRISSIDKEKPNSPPKLFPGWCGVVSDNSGFVLRFGSKELSLNDWCACHVQLHVWWGILAQAAGRPLRHYKNKALIPHVDCSMRQSRSSRFAQSVNSVNELKTLPQSTVSKRSPCEFHHCWNLSVSNCFESVHPMGHPMSHSVQSGFRCPVG